MFFSPVSWLNKPPLPITIFLKYDNLSSDNNSLANDEFLIFLPKLEHTKIISYSLDKKFLQLLSIGFNCALGAKMMKPYLEVLSKNTKFGVSSHPNAGLPNEFGEYDESPEDMANQIKEFLEDNLINIIGGCCGTTPEHIKAIVELAAKYEPRKLN